MLLSLFCSLSFAQAGYSTASVHQNRSNAILTPDQVVVKEYINYHKHNIPIPKGADEVAFSTDQFWTGDKGVFNEFILQVGVATRNEASMADKAPVNVCLVIDKSGSMASQNRMGKVKAALHKFAKGLRPWDYVSIVTYDGAAFLIQAAQKLNDIENLDATIEGIYPGGSTNLNEGLMMGYREVQRNYSKEYTNKVILLTDGLTNAGITDLNQIAKSSASFNRIGIDVSTIGVGHNLNHELLKKISDEGRGANHFIGDNEEDIAKVFEQELQSLLAPIGKNVFVEVNIPKGFVLDEIYGYGFEQFGDRIRIPLKNINQGLTQVILCKFIVESRESSTKLPTAIINYWSNSKQSNQCLDATPTHWNQADRGKEIHKSHTIAQMATALKKMASLAQKGEYNRAHSYMDTELARAKMFYQGPWDKDLQRVEKILEKELTDLKGYFSTSGY